MADPTPTETENIHISVITCPSCGHQRTETMPEYSCAIIYRCAGCGATLRPAEGDCCVYCTYGSVPCPAIQKIRQADTLPDTASAQNVATEGDT